MGQNSNHQKNKQYIERPDRREVLKKCAAAAAAAALGNTMIGCALKPLPPGADQLFQPVPLNKLQAGIDEVSRMMLGFLEETTTNDTAMKKMSRVLNQVGLHDGALSGPEAPVNQFGHGVIFNGGEHGFLTTRAYADSKFVLPLIIQKGIDTTLLDTKQAGANGCTWTEGKCTPIIGDGCHTDDGADDDSVGWGVIDYDAFRLQRVDYFDIDDIIIYQSIMRHSVDILMSDALPKQTVLNEWLDDKKASNGERHCYVTVYHNKEATWVNWLVKFANGAAVIVQVAKGNVQPVYSDAMRAKRGDLNTQAEIDIRRLKTNQSDTDIVFPMVWAKH